LDRQKLHVQWSSQGEKMTYHCQVAREENFLHPVLDTKTDQPEIILPVSEEKGRYFVRVSTIDPSGQEGAFSSVQQVESKDSSPMALVITIEVLIAVLLFAL
jgi:hypothetical protein